jgi:nitrogen PTS system EIIA component
MKLTDFISERSVSPGLAATEKKRALAEMSALLANGARGVRADEILDVLKARERLATTGIGDGIAIPHGKIRGLPRVIAAIGVSRDGVPFDAVDGKDVHIFVGLLAPESGGAGDHLKLLARLSRLLRDAAFRERLLSISTAAEIIEAFSAADEGA